MLSNACSRTFGIISNSIGMTQPSKQKPSLEDLLKFKRAEQPTSCFWNRFDRELNHKMLKTLVKKESVWVRLRHSIHKYTHAWVPVTGVALLTLFAVVHKSPSALTTFMAKASTHTHTEGLNVEFPDADTFFKEYNLASQGSATFVQNTLPSRTFVKNTPAFVKETLSSARTNKVRYVVSGMANTVGNASLKTSAGRLF